MLPPWVIVLTKSTAEDAAESSLRQVGYRVYVPRYRKVLLPHGRQRRPDQIMRPLFERLVFVQDWRGWPSKIRIIGTVGLMPARPGVAQLCDADVALIMERERAGDFDMVGPHGDDTQRGDLAIGDEVEFDAFGAKIMGVLEALSPNGKAIVSALIFGRIVRTEVGAGSLRMAYGVAPR